MLSRVASSSSGAATHSGIVMQALFVPKGATRYAYEQRNASLFWIIVVAWHGASIANSSAQQTPKIHRVGILNPNSPAIAGKYIQAFRDEMRRLGYTDANLVVELRYAEGRSERLKELAVDLMQSKVEVFLAPSEPALLAAKEVGGATPIVSVSCDPLEKFVGRLNRPGGNVTGFSCVSSALAGKRLSLLKTLVPNLNRVALLYSLPDAYEPDLNSVEQSAQQLGLSVTRFPVKSAADFEHAVRSNGERPTSSALHPAQRICKLPSSYAGTTFIKTPPAGDLWFPGIS